MSNNFLKLNKGKTEILLVINIAEMSNKSKQKTNLASLSLSSDMCLEFTMLDNSMVALLQHPDF